MNDNIIIISPTLGLTTVRPISIPDLVDLCCSAITGATLQTLNNIENSPEEEGLRKKVADELFDAMNYSFTKCLENTFPEQELRRDISAEAILETENQLLKEELEELVAEEG